MNYLIQNSARIILCIFILFPSFLSAQGKKNIEKYAIVDLIVLDTSMLNNSSIKFEIQKNDLNTNFNLDNNIYDFAINKIRTRVKIPLSVNVNYGKIKYFYNGQTRTGQPFNQNAQSIYIFENKDTIELVLTKNSIKFLGKKSAKYNCQEEIYNQQIHLRSEEFNNYYTKKRYDKMFEAFKKQEDSLIKVKLNILNLYKPKIPKEIHDLMLADCLGYYYDKLNGILNFKLRKPEFKQSIERTYLKWFSKIDFKNLDEKILIKSFAFCDFLLRKDQFESSLINETSESFKDESYTFKQVYEQIQKNHNGPIRDKVTLLAFYFDLVRKSAKSYLTPAYNTMGENIYKDYLSILLTNYFGSNYNFELFDQYGALRKLSHFKGKLVVIDFWFTGCVACAKLAKALKPIIKSYKDNNKIVFISISIDSNKEMWLESVNKETYSNKEDINLFTNGLGANHELIKKYNIQGYPALMVISPEGDLLTTSAPRPLEGSPKKINAFKDFINKYL